VHVGHVMYVVLTASVVFTAVCSAADVSVRAVAIYHCYQLSMEQYVAYLHAVQHCKTELLSAMANTVLCMIVLAITTNCR
jgi:hypothetical protein